jgi:carboxyl-terminal processing protease
MNRLSRGAVVGAILVPLVTAGFIAQESSTRDGARLFGQVLDLVGTRFVDTVSAADLYEKAARGLVEQLQDPYSDLLSPKQLAMFNTTTGGRYGGLGMQIEEQKGKGVTVARVFPHTPAERSGIREGDVIVAIDSASSQGWNTTRVSDVLKGTPGTKVNVTFARPGVTSPINVTFTRAIIKVPAVPYAILLDDSIGYIPLQQFNESAHGDLAAGVKQLQSDGAKSLVIDLRGNPGGYLEQALEISNLFLAQGQEIASVRGRAQPTQTYVAREQPLAPTLPLVVLTDQYTASASEIVAGALQDHDRAVVMGTTSFGKGLVQTLFNLDGGYALKMTTGKWFTPNGRSIQKERKLMPDGSFVEVHPDSLESDSARMARPKYKSDAGRVVYGGGAITPDIIVKPDTLTTAEKEFLKAIAPASQDYYVTLYDFSFEKKDQVKPDFVVTPAWRDDFYNRLQQKKVPVDRALYDSASRYVDATIGGRVASLAFGDSVAKRRAVPDDAALLAAMELLKRGQTQQELFALVRLASPE